MFSCVFIYYTFHIYFYFLYFLYFTCSYHFRVLRFVLPIYCIHILFIYYFNIPIFMYCSCTIFIYLYSCIVHFSYDNHILCFSSYTVVLYFPIFSSFTSHILYFPIIFIYCAFHILYFHILYFHIRYFHILSSCTFTSYSCNRILSSHNNAMLLISCYILYAFHLHILVIYFSLSYAVFVHILFSCYTFHMIIIYCVFYLIPSYCTSLYFHLVLLIYYTFL